MTDDTMETAAAAPVEPTLDEASEEEADPDATVAAAEAEQTAEELKVEVLERQFVDGDETVGQEQIERQRGLAGFAKLRVQRARVKAERIKAERRQRAAEAIAAEAETYAGSVGVRMAKALEKIAAAEAAFLAITDEHDSLVEGWRVRAEALRIPQADGGPWAPPAIDGRLALGDSLDRRIKVGRRWFGGSDGKWFLDTFRKDLDRPALIDRARNLDAETPEPAPDTVFMRNRVTGAVFTYSPDLVPTGPLLSPDLEVISREEASRR